MSAKPFVLENGNIQQNSFPPNYLGTLIYLKNIPIISKMKKYSQMDRRDYVKNVSAAIALCGTATTVSGQSTSSQLINPEGGEGTLVGEEEYVKNEHWSGDYDVHHCSSIWHTQSFASDDTFTHHFLTTGYGAARDGNSKINGIHNQWSEALPGNGEVNLIEMNSHARLGNEETETGSSAIAVGGTLGLALAGIAALAASKPIAAAVGGAALTSAWFQFVEYWIDDESVVAEWAHPNHSDASHTAWFTWTHDQNTRSECGITIMTGAAGKQQTVVGQSQSIQPTDLNHNKVSASKVDSITREQLCVSKTDEVYVLDDSPLEVIDEKSIEPEQK